MGGQSSDGVMNSSPRVWVPPARLEEAREAGIARANYAFDHNYNNYGDPLPQSEQMANHIRGARCEVAVAVDQQMAWSPSVGVLGGPDVGDIVQVRSKPYPPGGDLAFRPARDADDAPFVLVWDCGDHFLIRGWLWGHECRASSAPVYTGGYKYVLPPYREISTLKAELNRRAAPKQSGSRTATATAP